MDMKEIGGVERVPYEIKQFEWTIDEFFSAVEDERYRRYASPTFSFPDDVQWHLRLWPRWAWGSKYEFIDVYLVRDVEREYSVEYCLGLRRRDGSMEQLVSGIMDEDKTISYVIHLIKKADLVQQKDELVPGNVFTVICTLKLMTEIIPSTQRNVLDEAKPLKIMRLDKLSENFKDLHADKDTCDVTLKVKNKEYKAHKTILIARSSVFAATFKHDTLERQTGVINIPDCDPDSFHEFLEYLYSGKLEELSLTSAFNLYYTSEKYDVEELKTFCLEYLMQSLTIENMCDIGMFADKYDQSELFGVVQDFFNKNSLKILLTSEWEQLLKEDYRLANKFLTDMAKKNLKE